MSKIYMVDAGDYTSEPIGYFSSREQAEELAAYYPKKWISIEEIETDLPLPYPKKMKRYGIVFSKTQVLAVNHTTPNEKPDAPAYVVEHDFKHSSMCVVRWANDEKHAREIGEQYRQTIVSAGEWEPEEAFQARLHEKAERDKGHIDFTFTAKDLTKMRKP